MVFICKSFCKRFLCLWRESISKSDSSREFISHEVDVGLIGALGEGE